MAIIVVGGSGHKSGKTALICGLIAALPDFPWTAVKVAAHVHHPEPVWEETLAGQGTDTARYLAAGARRALLVSAPDNDVPMAAIRAALASDENVMFESSRIADYLQSDVVLAVIRSHDDWKASFPPLLRRADAMVVMTEEAWTSSGLPNVPVFRMQDPAVVPSGMIAWLRQRLTAPRKV